MKSNPRSPFCSCQLCRDDDTIILIDLHPAEVLSLKHNFGWDQRVHIHERDGVAALTALTPLTPRRGLIFGDQAYEEKLD